MAHGGARARSGGPAGPIGPVLERRERLRLVADAARAARSVRTADTVGASRDVTERLGDEIRNYDPSGGTGRFKSIRTSDLIAQSWAHAPSPQQVAPSTRSGL